MNDIRDTHDLFPIVGVGASAGGLDAFSQLLHCLPSDPSMAFVLIQHLDRSHPSLLGEVLAGVTMMPVHEAEHGMRVESGHVYVITPNTDIALSDGLILITKRPDEGEGTHLPIDFLMRSLASELGSRAIGVVLSGSASDGTEGLRAIRAAGGITLVQDPRNAKFPDMPRNAVEAGVVDYCLDIAPLASELVRLSRNPYTRMGGAELTDDSQGLRDQIYARVRNLIGIDFSTFKPATVERRLARRMALRNSPDLPAYLALLDADPQEVRALYEDTLIHVTSFFRDAPMFEALATRALPEILKHKPDGGSIRVWVAGCSTGEEAYSIAIVLLELLAETRVSHPIQIFGSDVSELAIEKARSGVYGEEAMRGVSEERRARFFGKSDDGYRVNKRVRDLCVFACHDLVRDPPFSRLDLVSCRNVLIYFGRALQKKVLPTLHYCLNQPGFLVLGRSESVSGFGQLFSVVDDDNKIFARTAGASGVRFVPRLGMQPASVRSHERPRERGSDHSEVLAKHLDRLLLARYSPPGVLVNENLEVLLFRGATGRYLQAAPGRPQTNLRGMLRGGLLSVLPAAIAEAKQERVVIQRPDIEVDRDGVKGSCDLTIIPFMGLPNASEPLFVVLFDSSRHDLGRAAAPAPASVPAPATSGAPPAATDGLRYVRLEQELAATQQYLHTVIEEHSRANDELGASNEELVSGNEELQSTNEELETAKEELQSINEELTTLNDELQRRNQETTQINSDLLNFSLAVDVAILRLDLDRCIRRFTPQARSILNVLPSDVGRSIHDIRLNIDVPDLEQQISDVLETTGRKESEVQDRTGRWFRMQIRPYTTVERSIEGVVISLVDVDNLKHLVAEAETARGQAESANRAKDDFLATLSHELRTPLSSMLLNAQRLRSGDVLAPADMRRMGEVLERSAKFQVKLVDDLLDVSRIIAGKLSLDLGPVDLCSVVRAALESVSAPAEAKSLVLRASLDPGLAMITADRVRVQQVVTNLLTNAIKFTPAHGTLTIEVDSTPAFARLRVTDSGIGIEPEFLPHVFSRFTQSDSSITRTNGGLGLGLAIVRHLVELHGGTASAQSDGRGRGATFVVTFPFTNASVAPFASRNVLNRPGRQRNYDGLVNLRVLFVDDDAQTRDAVLEVLRLTGANVEVAVSAADGMRMVDSFNPQVILCDIAMPGEDGYTFIRKLRARTVAEGSHTPALALTALAAEDDRRRALDAGFQRHLAKPIDIDRLRDAVLELSTCAIVDA